MAFTLFLLSWFILVILFLYVSINLLFSLIVLEVITFFSLVFIAFNCGVFFTDYLLLTLFSVFIIEGVIGISCLINLVMFSGSDYVGNTSSLLL